MAAKAGGAETAAVTLLAELLGSGEGSVGIASAQAAEGEAAEQEAVGEAAGEAGWGSAGRVSVEQESAAEQGSAEPGLQPAATSASWIRRRMFCTYNGYAAHAP